MFKKKAVFFSNGKKLEFVINIDSMHLVFKWTGTNTAVLDYEKCHFLHDLKDISVVFMYLPPPPTHTKKHQQQQNSKQSKITH